MGLNLRMTFNIPVTIAVILAEIISILWYANLTDGSNRYLVTALICDVGLALVIHYILKHYWVFSGWLDGLQMGLAVGLLFFCLQAPHVVYGPRSLLNFAGDTLHKALLVTVISCALFYGRKIKIT